MTGLVVGIIWVLNSLPDGASLAATRLTGAQLAVHPAAGNADSCGGERLRGYRHQYTRKAMAADSLGNMCACLQYYLHAAL